MQAEWEARDRTREERADQRRDADRDYPQLRRRRRPPSRFKQRSAAFWKGALNGRDC